MFYCRKLLIAAPFWNLEVSLMWFMSLQMCVYVCDSWVNHWCAYLLFLWESHASVLTFMLSCLKQMDHKQTFLFSTLIKEMTNTLSICDIEDYIFHHLAMWDDILYNIFINPLLSWQSKLLYRKKHNYVY